MHECNFLDKSESIWDNFVHNYPEKIEDRSTGDTACDSYHKYEEDVAIVKNIGVLIFRNIIPNFSSFQIINSILSVSILSIFHKLAPASP